MCSDLLTATIHVRFMCSEFCICTIIFVYLEILGTSLLLMRCASASIGSYKEHEHSGCKLCESTRYCKPNDSKYCCPCEWHQLERVKQASAVEDNIRK